jgi:hypothetical protein
MRQRVFLMHQRVCISKLLKLLYPTVEAVLSEDPSKDGHYAEILAGVGVHQQLDLSVDSVIRDHRPLEGHAPERLDLFHVSDRLVQQLFGTLPSQSSFSSQS